MAILPDVLDSELKVVFCGTAVGEMSAQAGAYYARPGNRFWPVLHRIGLVPRELSPVEYQELLAHRIGLTDIAQEISGTDRRLGPGDFDVAGLRTKIERYDPIALAFNGKNAAKAFLGRAVDYGQQQERVGKCALFVLPSTSGNARGYWDESYWRQLAHYVS